MLDGFKTTKGFPQAVGTIDGTHIPIIRPEPEEVGHTALSVTVSDIILALIGLIRWDK